MGLPVTGCPPRSRGSARGMDRQKLLIAVAAAIAAALAITGIVTGQPEFLIPTALVALVVGVIVVAEKGLSRAVMRHRRSAAAARKGNRRRR